MAAQPTDTPVPDAAAVGRVVDPTKNVLDLVDAAIGRQDDLREAETRRINERFEQHDKFLEQRDKYETRIASMLADSVKSTSQLISDQLAQQSTRFDTRLSELERFRYESSGKTSATDPALAAALAGIASGMTALQSAVATLRTSDDMAAGGSKRQSQTTAFVFSIIAVAVAVLGFVASVVVDVVAMLGPAPGV